MQSVHLEHLQLPLSLPLGAVRWSVIGDHYSELLAMIAVLTLTILLNSTGIGLATRRDIDFNHELRSAGIVNIVSSLFGGVVGCQSISRTLLAFHAGSRGRATGTRALRAWGLRPINRRCLRTSGCISRHRNGF